MSLFGDWFNLLALLAMLRAIGGESATAFAGVLILKTVPTLLVAPTAGVIVDRLPRRLVMMASDALRALIVLAMLTVILFPSVWLLYALIIAQTVVASFFEPARTALLPDIVSDEELPAANALGAATWSAMLTLGTAAGGVFTALVGWQGALLVDVASYGLSMVLLFGLKEPQYHRENAPRQRTLWALAGIDDFLWGIRYLVRRPKVLSMALVKSGWTFVGSTTLLLTLLGEQEYIIGGSLLLGVTVLYVARGVGTGIGPIASRALVGSDPVAMEKCIAAGFVCGGVFYLCVAVSPNLVVAAICVALAHIGGATVWVFSTIRLQQMLPSGVRGRVFSAEQALFTSMVAVCTGLHGWLFDQELVQLRTLVVFVGVGLFLPAVLWVIRGLRLGWAKEDDRDLLSADRSESA